MAYPQINKSLAQTRYSLTQSIGRGISHIVVHYTACDAPATNFCKAFAKPNLNASADYFIGKDGEIAQFNGDIRNYYSWHCGDGHGRYGISNAHSVGIEVVSTGEEFNQKQKDALRALTLAIMEEYNIPASKVVRHYDASRKLCPAPYSGNAAKDAKWEELRRYITTEQEDEDMVDANTLKNIEFTRPDGHKGNVYEYFRWNDARIEKIDELEKKVNETNELVKKLAAQSGIK